MKLISIVCSTMFYLNLKPIQTASATSFFILPGQIESLSWDFVAESEEPKSDMSLTDLGLDKCEQQDIIAYDSSVQLYSQFLGKMMTRFSNCIELPAEVASCATFTTDQLSRRLGR